MIVMFAAVTVAASASTVTLTGYCPTAQTSINNGTIRFTLSNSGNGSAINPIVYPNIQGIITTNETYTAQQLNPDSEHTFNMAFNSIGMHGTYAGYFLVEYGQGTTTQFAVFPCYVDVGAQTTSNVVITGMNASGSRLAVSMYNLGSEYEYVNLSIAAPPTFSATPQYKYVSLDSHSSATTIFNITLPQASGIFTMAGVATYENNAIRYAYLYPYQVNTELRQKTGSLAGGTISQNLPLIGLGTAIVIVICLIMLSHIKKCKNGKFAHIKQNTETGQGASQNDQ
jgi:hypothetical protein